MVSRRVLLGAMLGAMLQLLLLPASSTASDFAVAEEVTSFAVSNGFQPLNVIRVQDPSSPSKGRDIQKLVKSLQNTSNLQLRTRGLREVSMIPYEIINEDFLFSEIQNQNDWLSILPVLSHIRVNSAMLISSWEFTNLPSGGLNVHAYLLQRSTMSWFEITGLNKTKNVLIRKVAQCRTSQLAKSVRPNLDFLNVTLNTVDLTFKPYISMDGCQSKEVRCKPEGLSGRFAQLASSFLNLTLEFSKEPHGEWGTLPLQGDKRFKNATWIGIMGQIISGQSHLSISLWYTKVHRLDLFDFATIYSTSMDTVLSLRPSDIDLGFFIRPFTRESWMAIIIALLLIKFCTSLTLYANGGNTNAFSFKFTFTSGMLFWILLHAFYSGALTMFFSNDKGPNFASFEEIVKAYPEWKLIIFEGSQNTFESLPPESEALEEFYHRIQSKPEETIAATAMEGMNRVASERVVIQLPRDVILYLVNNNASLSNQYKIAFSLPHKTYLSFLFTDNSPMTSAFELCFLHMQEFGITDRVIQQWIGGMTSNKEMAVTSTVAVTPGQLTLIFIIMLAALFVTMVTFLMEVCYHHWGMKGDSRKESLHPNP